MGIVLNIIRCVSPSRSLGIRFGTFLWMWGNYGHNLGLCFACDSHCAPDMFFHVILFHLQLLLKALGFSFSTSTTTSCLFYKLALWVFTICLYTGWFLFVLVFSFCIIYWTKYVCCSLFPLIALAYTSY